ncbi:hypothetical protein JTE90_023365 [Oedothorax gibbosus]|uniref:Addiction module toxin RelE n=1 Tax=Oedothorax gibbosus TaxID=931172 RepID=A0AAV6V1Z3_9ARAC|nr:hypothetical protein JTE90_023365 [Oedothorax gibbosus]
MIIVKTKSFEAKYNKFSSVKRFKEYVDYKLTLIENNEIINSKPFTGDHIPKGINIRITRIHEKYRLLYVVLEFVGKTVVSLIDRDHAYGNKKNMPYVKELIEQVNIEKENCQNSKRKRK